MAASQFELGDKWELVRLDDDQVRVYKNFQLGLAVEEYCIDVLHTDLDVLIQEWTRRKNPPPYVLRVLGWKVSRAPCGQDVKLYVEHVGKRLESWGGLRLRQALGACQKILTAVEGLMLEYKQSFFLTNRMVGKNDDNEIRVWISEKWWSSQPNSLLNKKYLFEFEREEDLINEVFRLVKDKVVPKCVMDYGEFFLSIRRPLTFKRVHAELRNWETSFRTSALSEQD